MKMIGLIGGMSWESSSVYYRRLNEQIRRRLGGLHSADVIMRSIDFAEIVALQREGNWKRAGEIRADVPAPAAGDELYDAGTVLYRTAARAARSDPAGAERAGPGLRPCHHL